jgi:hypothetical protein
MTLRHQKRGQDHIYSDKQLGRDVKVSVTSNGWRLKVDAEIKFEALTTKQATAAMHQLHIAIDTAIRTAASQRHENVPLFDLPDEAQTINTQGVNTL